MMYILMKTLAIHFPLVICSVIFLFITFLYSSSPSQTSSNKSSSEINNFFTPSLLTNKLTVLSSSSMQPISEEKKYAGNSGEVTPAIHPTSYIIQTPLPRLFSVFLSFVLISLIGGILITKTRKHSLHY